MLQVHCQDIRCSKSATEFDHFQIRAHIAKGGMSDIYRAYDLLSGKEVVLKIPDAMSIGDPAQYERFQRELEVMKTLRSPGDSERIRIRDIQ